MWTIQEKNGKKAHPPDQKKRSAGQDFSDPRGNNKTRTPRLSGWGVFVREYKRVKYRRMFMRERKSSYQHRPKILDAKKRGVSELLTPRLVRPMRFERTTFRVGVWHSIQLSYGHIFSLSIISGIYGFCKGKQEKQKNIQNLRKKLLTFCEQGDKINKLSPTGRQRRCTLKIEQHSLEIDWKVNGESL